MHSEGHEIIDKEIRVGEWIKCRELIDWWSQNCAIRRREGERKDGHFTRSCNSGLRKKGERKVVLETHFIMCHFESRQVNSPQSTPIRQFIWERMWIIGYVHIFQEENTWCKWLDDVLDQLDSGLTMMMWKKIAMKEILNDFLMFLSFTSF